MSTNSASCVWSTRRQNQYMSIAIICIYICLAYLVFGITLWLSVWWMIISFFGLGLRVRVCISGFSQNSFLNFSKFIFFFMHISIFLPPTRLPWHILPSTVPNTPYHPQPRNRTLRATHTRDTQISAEHPSNTKDVWSTNAEWRHDGHRIGGHKWRKHFAGERF